MSDVGKIPGEKGPRPSEEPKRKKGPDSEAFREMMKVGKVRETDPEEKRKRKSQAEAEEEFTAQQAGPAPHQGLGAEAPPPPFLGAEESQQPTGGVGAEPPPNLPATAPQYTPGVEPAPEPQEPQPIQEGAPSKKKKRKKKAEGPAPKEVITAPTKKGKTEKGELKKKAEIPPSKLAQPQKAEKKETTRAPKLPKAEEGPPVKEPEKKEKQVAGQLEGIEQKPLPPGGWEASKETEKKQEPTGPSLEVETQSPGTQAGITPVQPEAAPSPLAAPFAHLPPQIAQIFERMVGVMTVMNESGITETTINLDNPQYANSVFYGAQITISEFSTAPKEFNIELTGNQQALNLMEANAEELVAAFQAGKYNFKVNRIDLSQQRPTGEVKRREIQRVKRKKPKGG